VRIYRESGDEPSSPRLPYQANRQPSGLSANRNLRACDRSLGPVIHSEIVEIATKYPKFPHKMVGYLLGLVKNGGIRILTWGWGDE
jgi:hypothetical protein